MFRKGRKGEDGTTPSFPWTRCRRCHSYECEVGDDVLIVEARKCTPSQGQWYDYGWEVRLGGGESISGRQTYSERQIDEAKADAEDAYLKWSG